MGDYIMNERRKSKRLSMTGVLMMKALSGNGPASEVSIDIQNCSRHGLGFNCDEQLVIGDNYQAELTIWTKEVINVFLQIVRSEKREDGLYNYGCIFIGMPDSDRQRIAVYETVEELVPHDDDDEDE